MDVRRSSSNSKDFGIFANNTNANTNDTTSTTATTTINGIGIGNQNNSNNNLMNTHNNNNNYNGPHCLRTTNTSNLPYSNGSSTNNDIEDEEDDEYCVYTYKGDPSSNTNGGPGADLPSSFFSFDQGETTNSSSNTTATSDELPGSSNLSMPSASASSLCYRLQNGLDTHSSSNGTLHHTNPNGSVVTISGNPVINGLIGVSGNVYSPDMDFLEMDFDPGVPDEEDESPENIGEEAMNHLLQTLSTSDTISSQSLKSNSSSSVSVLSNSINGDVTDGCVPGPSTATTSIVRPLDMPNSSNSSPSKKPCIKYEMTSNEGIVVESISASPDSSDEVELPSQTAHKPCCSKSLSLNNSNSNLLHGCSISSPVVENNASRFKTIRTNNSNSTTLSASVSNISTPFLLSSPKREQVVTSVKLVKSNTLPEISAHNSTDPEDVQRAKISFSIPLIKNKVDGNLHAAFGVDEDSVEVNVESVMIWSLSTAQTQSITQIGKSACGATAVCNVLMALGHEVVNPENVEKHVQTRLRKLDAEIPEYLFSRSVAGATHLDLINAVVQITSGEINGRLFHPSPGIPPEVFANWLFKWICKGAIPVATRNLQVVVDRERDFDEGEEIPDSWHHQMIFGTTAGGRIFLTNPIECIQADKLLPQLASDSVLLVRRQDIISRKTPNTDLRDLGKHADPRWKEMNVLGQVANLFLEGELVFNGTSVARRVRTSHIEIPAAYVGGITLFMKTDSQYYEELQNASEF